MEAEQDDLEYQAAKKRVEDLKGFYTHLAVYLVVNAGLFLVNYATNRHTWWFYWPLIGWGIALAIHAVVTFVIEGQVGARWEERKIRELVERDRRTIQGSMS
jgi:hypothetical protein